MNGLENRNHKLRAVICRRSSPVCPKHGTRAPGLFPAFAKSEVPGTPSAAPRLLCGVGTGGRHWAAAGFCAAGAVCPGRQGPGGFSSLFFIFNLIFLFIFKWKIKLQISQGCRLSFSRECHTLSHMGHMSAGIRYWHGLSCSLAMGLATPGQGSPGETGWREERGRGALDKSPPRS